MFSQRQIMTHATREDQPQYRHSDQASAALSAVGRRYLSNDRTRTEFLKILHDTTGQRYALKISGAPRPPLPTGHTSVFTIYGLSTDRILDHLKDYPSAPDLKSLSDISDISPRLPICYPCHHASPWIDLSTTKAGKSYTAW